MKMVTESQNGSGWKGPKRSSNPNFPAMEEYLPPKQVALSPVKLGLEHFKGVLTLVTRREEWGQFILSSCWGLLRNKQVLKSMCWSQISP